VLFKLNCKRCNHLWVPRKEDVKKCPRCGSYLWKTKRKGEENEN